MNDICTQAYQLAKTAIDAVNITELELNFEAAKEFFRARTEAELYKILEYMSSQTAALGLHNLMMIQDSFQGTPEHFAFMRAHSNTPPPKEEKPLRIAILSIQPPLQLFVRARTPLEEWEDLARRFLDLIKEYASQSRVIDEADPRYEKLSQDTYQRQRDLIARGFKGLEGDMGY
jgi:hypothetical protein